MGCQYYDPHEGCANSFSIAMPKLTFGRGSLGEVGARAVRAGVSNVVLMTDPHLNDGPIVAQVKNSLQSAGIKFRVFSDVDIEPSDVSVGHAVAFLDDADYDGVISVGGGSVIDTAKAALAVSAHKTQVNRFFAPPIGEGVPIPGPVKTHIACPTTSGTGSECTSVSVLRVRELGAKFVIGSPWLVPDVALIDPACCDSLPGNVVASTGFDALCHALECYTAKAYTQHAAIPDVNARQLLQGANPWSEMAAREALTLVSTYIERAVADTSDHEARDQMSWSATLAGMAFGNSGTHLPHAMSYGVTHLMNNITTDGYPQKSPFVPHGISVAVTAPAIFKYQAEATPDRHMEAALLIDADTTGATPADAGEVLSNRFIQLMRGCHLPNGLSGVGFGLDDVKALAESSIRQGRAIANAPRETNQVDLENLYAAAITHW
ncbi:MAG: iron-containing alcohol dehydrogenase [Gammaproteobacteria bacterium]|nr:iron-containing alcohol dehydrogenase [Gammaproteobacteria bacterium]